jgi:hypothetical protein
MARQRVESPSVFAYSWLGQLYLSGEIVAAQLGGRGLELRRWQESWPRQKPRSNLPVT